MSCPRCHCDECQKHHRQLLLDALKAETEKVKKMTRDEARAYIRSKNPGMYDEEFNLTEEYGGMTTDYR